MPRLASTLDEGRRAIDGVAERAVERLDHALVPLDVRLGRQLVVAVHQEVVLLHLLADGVPVGLRGGGAEGRCHLMGGASLCCCCARAGEVAAKRGWSRRASSRARFVAEQFFGVGVVQKDLLAFLQLKGILDVLVVA